MRAFIINRKVGRKGIWTAAALLVATGVASASLAGAQVVAPPPDLGDPVAPAPRIVTTCGAMVEDTIITQNTPRTTNAANFQRLPGAVATVHGPACIKVLLTAETACGPTANPDYCYVRAIVDGVPMDPDGAGFQAMDSEDDSASAHAYEWVKEVGDGDHQVEIQWRVFNGGGPFYIDDWTMDVMTLGL
jgi:hypothetical protein